MRIDVYVTKWALTRGILLYRNVEVEPGESMVQIGPCNYAHGEGREWHRSEYAARERCEELRMKALRSAQSRVHKLKGMEFKVKGA